MKLYDEMPVYKRSASNASHDHKLDIAIGCVYIGISLIGSVVNLLVLCIFIRMYRRGHHGNNIIQGMLALVDLCNCSLSLPYTCYGLLSERDPQIQGFWKDLSGFVFNTASRATILFMALIAAYRLAMFTAPMNTTMSEKALRPKVILTISLSLIFICIFVSCVPLIWGKGYSWSAAVGFSGWQITELTTKPLPVKILATVLILIPTIIPVFITIILSVVSVFLLRQQSYRINMINSHRVNIKKTNSYKAIHTLRYLLLTYSICYSGWVLNFINYYVAAMSFGKVNLLRYLPRMGITYLFTLSLLLVNLNALINPIMSLTRGQGMKETFNSFIWRRRRGRRGYGPPTLVKMTVINMVDLPAELQREMTLRQSRRSNLRASHTYHNLKDDSAPLSRTRSTRRSHLRASHRSDSGVDDSAPLSTPAPQRIGPRRTSVV